MKNYLFEMEDVNLLSAKAIDDFEQGFQYALHVLDEHGVDVESILGPDIFKNKVTYN